MTRTAMMLLATTLVLAACDQVPDPTGATAAEQAPTVAVLDVDAVAKALGRDDVFRQQIQAAGRQLQQQLSELSSGLEDKVREEQAEIGLATGLAWTQMGGEILHIEVTTMPGKGKLTITGKLGEVMQESAQAALSYVRSRANFLSLEEDFYQKIIHFT